MGSSIETRPNDVCVDAWVSNERSDLRAYREHPDRVAASERLLAWMGGVPISEIPSPGDCAAVGYYAPAVGRMQIHRLGPDSVIRRVYGFEVPSDSIPVVETDEDYWAKRSREGVTPFGVFLHTGRQSDSPKDPTMFAYPQEDGAYHMIFISGGGGFSQFELHQGLVFGFPEVPKLWNPIYEKWIQISQGRKWQGKTPAVRAELRQRHLLLSGVELRENPTV